MKCRIRATKPLQSNLNRYYIFKFSTHFVHHKTLLCSTLYSLMRFRFPTIQYKFAFAEGHLSFELPPLFPHFSLPPDSFQAYFRLHENIEIILHSSNPYLAQSLPRFYNGLNKLPRCIALVWHLSFDSR